MQRNAKLATASDWSRNEFILRQNGCVILWGYNTQVPLSLPDTKQQLQPHIIIGHSPERLVAVCCGKGQRSCDADPGTLSSLCSLRHKVQAGGTAISILSDSLSLFFFFCLWLYTRVSSIACCCLDPFSPAKGWVHWARTVWVSACTAN